MATLKGLLHAATSQEFRIFVDCVYTWESRWPRPTSGVNNLLTLVANDGLIDINSLMNLGRSNDVLYYISTKVTPPPPAPIAPHINFVLPRRSAMCVRQRCQCVWALGGRVSPGVGGVLWGSGIKHVVLFCTGEPSGVYVCCCFVERAPSEPKSVVLFRRESPVRTEVRRGSPVRIEVCCFVERAPSESKSAVSSREPRQN